MAGCVFSVSLSCSPGPSKQSCEIENPSAASMSSKTRRAAGNASATSFPIPEYWLPCPGKTNAVSCSIGAESYTATIAANAGRRARETRPPIAGRVLGGAGCRLCVSRSLEECAARSGPRTDQADRSGGMASPRAGRRTAAATRREVESDSRSDLLVHRPRDRRVLSRGRLVRADVRRGTSRARQHRRVRRGGDLRARLRASGHDRLHPDDGRGGVGARVFLPQQGDRSLDAARAEGVAGAAAEGDDSGAVLVILRKCRDPQLRAKARLTILAPR